MPADADMTRGELDRFEHDDELQVADGFGSAD
jgi:hypothetical protein